MKSVSIPAAINGNPGVYSERNMDTVFVCISSDGPCTVQLGSQAAASCIAGLVLGTPGGPQIQTLTLQNTGVVAVNVTFDTGNVAQQGAVPTAPIENFFNLPLYASPGSVTGTRAIGAAGANPGVIPGTQLINGVSKTRQFIEITNLDSSQLIYVYTDHQTGPTFDQCIGIVFPLSYRRFRTPKNLYLFNLGASALQSTAWEQY